MGNPTNQLTVATGATLSFRSSSNIWSKGLVLNGDGLSPTITNANGSNTIAGPVTLNGSCVFAVSGPPLRLTAPIGGSGSLTKTSDGPLWLYGTNIYIGQTVVAAGTLALLDSASIAGSVELNIAPGALLDASGHNGGGFVLASGQTLSGNGSVRGDCTVGSGATLAQSDPSGNLTFSNSLTLGAGGSTVLGISKSPATNVPVRVSGNLAYGGQLLLANLGPNPPALGDSFQLFSAAAYTGGFANILPRTPGPGLLWDAAQLTRNGTMRVVAGNLPYLGAPALAGGRLYINGTGGTLGAAGRTCYLLTSANPGLPLTEWTCIATNQLDASGNFSFDSPVDTALPSSFYSVRLP
jgi:fibronectin-binding autotransporter adhesin